MILRVSVYNLYYDDSAVSPTGETKKEGDLSHLSVGIFSDIDEIWMWLTFCEQITTDRKV